MGRSGYTDDCDGEELNLWRGAVTRAIQGRRGQKFLHDLLAALDGLPQQRLIAEELVADGEVCALGSIARFRGIDVSGVEPDDHAQLARIFNIAPALVQEIEAVNDDEFGWRVLSPQQRFDLVRRWVLAQLAPKS